jgi:hypothetical protein
LQFVVAISGITAAVSGCGGTSNTLSTVGAGSGAASGASSPVAMSGVVGSSSGQNASSGGSATGEMGVSGGSTASTGGTAPGANLDGMAGPPAVDGGPTSSGVDSGTAAGADGGQGIGADTPPWRALNVTATPNQYVHTVFGSSVGLDTRAAKMAGKLIVDLGVDGGGYQSYLGKRGFHVFGVSLANDCSGIDDWTLGNDYDTNCRWNTLDGMPHGNQSSVPVNQSIMYKIQTGLTQLQQMYPTEDWGYFLNQDGSVRWSDVGWTGFSHGAQNASMFAHVLRSYRAVSQSGPRDNTCGKGTCTAIPIDLTNNPPYDVNCPGAHIATWIDMPPATPIDRFFGLVGTQDGQCGDDMFAMQRMGYPGLPIDLDKAGADLTASNRYYSPSTGHASLPGAFGTAVINQAFGVLPENLNPTF